jgi:4'-phosphopantetheinyl transferase EntD
MTRFFGWLAADNIAVHETGLAAPLPELFPEERIGLERAVRKRVREFTGGRYCARRCLEALGFDPVAILAGDNRMPVWPNGVVGSITHTDDHCAAVVARLSGGIASIGIDLEPYDDLPTDILDIVCRAEELAWLDDQPLDRRGLLAKAIFSAKECAYKAQYPHSRDMLEFHDFRVWLHADEQHFEAEFMRDCPPFSKTQRLQGQLRIAKGGIACAIVIAGG